jgi:hypothetical protein
MPVNTGRARKPSRIPYGVFWGGLVGLSIACSGCSRWASRQPSVFASENPSPTEIVSAINRNADSVRSLLAEDLDITVRLSSGIPILLDGKLALEKPSPADEHPRLRLTADHPVGGREADLGSNHEEFWCYVRRGPQGPALIHCNHIDYPRVRQALPFQPDWILDALGLTALPTGERHQIRPGRRGTVELLSAATGPQGQPATQVTVVQLNTGWIVERHIEVLGRRTASAFLSKHQRDSVFGTWYPGTVDIRWPEAELDLSIQLEDVVLNPQFDPRTAARLWSMPVEVVQAGAEDVDLGAALPPVSTRRSTKARLGHQINPAPDEFYEPGS